MRRFQRSFFSAVIFLIGLIWSGAGPAQSPTPLHVEPADTVTLDVVVTSGSGGVTTGLQQSDFTVLDNKVAKPITSFRAVSGPAAPVDVILLLDAVNARFDTVAYAREQIEKFLTRDGGELTHPVTLAVFTDKGTEIQQNGSRDGKALRAVLDQDAIGLRTVTRSTGFYGAEERLDYSLGALDALIKREESRPGRKLILWVSPGWPLFSGPGVQLSNGQQQKIFEKVVALSTRLRRARITLYNVSPLGTNESLLRSDYYKSFLNGVAKPSQTDAGDLGLQVLATQTGGLALTINNDIPGMLQRVMNDANAYYEISIPAGPAEHPDEYHRLDVQVNKPGETARTRNGYYAEPSPGMDAR